MLRRTKRSRVFRTLVLSSLLLLFPAAVGASSSPAELMNRSLSAAGAQHSVHLFGQVTSSGVVVDIVADVGLTRGEQKIGIAETGPNGRHGLATVVVTDGAAYVRGDRFALATFLGFDAAASARVAGRWVRISRSRPEYARVAADLTLPSVLEHTRLVGPLKLLGPSTSHGEIQMAIQGRDVDIPSATDVFYYAAKGLPLPAGEIARTASFLAVSTFSKWNEPINVSVPRGAIAIERATR